MWQGTEKNMEGVWGELFFVLVGSHVFFMCFWDTLLSVCFCAQAAVSGATTTAPPNAAECFFLAHTLLFWAEDTDIIL